MSVVGKTAAPRISSSGTRASPRNSGGRDGELSRNGKFRWSAGWAKWVPVPNPPPAGKEVAIGVESENQILGVAALQPIRHGSSCLCAQCATAGQRYSDYAKAKAVRNRGF